MALVWVEGELVDLPCVLMQSDKLHVGTIQVVQDDLAVGDSSSDMRAELSMRPFYVLDTQALTLSCMRVGIVECSSPQVGLVNNLGAIDTDGLEDLFASKYSMGPLTVDVKSGNVETRLVCGIKRVACSDAGSRT